MKMHAFQIQDFISGLNAPLPENWIILPTLPGFIQILKATPVKIDFSQIGIQDIAPLPQGEYMGKISFIEVKEMGLNYVMINHPDAIADSEIGKISKYQNQKIKNLISYGLIPIICLGNNIKDFIDHNENFTDLKTIVRNDLYKLLDGVVMLNDSEIIFVYMPNFYIENHIRISHEQIDLEMEVVNTVVEEYFNKYLKTNRISVIYGGFMTKKENYNLEKHGLFLDKGYDAQDAYYWIDVQVKNTKK